MKKRALVSLVPPTQRSPLAVVTHVASPPVAKAKLPSMTTATITKTENKLAMLSLCRTWEILVSGANPAATSSRIDAHTDALTCCCSAGGTASSIVTWCTPPKVHRTVFRSAPWMAIATAPGWCWGPCDLSLPRAWRTFGSNPVSRSHIGVACVAAVSDAARPMRFPHGFSA